MLLAHSSNHSNHSNAGNLGNEGSHRNTDNLSSKDGPAGIMTGPYDRQLMNHGSSEDRGNNTFIFSIASRLDVRPTQGLIQWIIYTFFRCKIPKASS
jgi:hypothetical protein